MSKKRHYQKKPCPVCGKRVSGPGLVGHMAWKHQMQYSAPLLPIENPVIPVGEARIKAAQLNAIAKMFENYDLKASPLSLLITELTGLGKGAAENEAYLADFTVLIRGYAAKQGISYADALADVKREKQLLDDIAKTFK